MSLGRRDDAFVVLVAIVRPHIEATTGDDCI